MYPQLLLQELKGQGLRVRSRRRREPSTRRVRLPASHNAVEEGVPRAGLGRAGNEQLSRSGMGRRCAAHAGGAGAGQAVTACFWSLLVTWILRGLAASWTGMVRVSTPAA
jgi:hypothetical protein